MEKLFFELIRVALGKRDALSANPSDSEWRRLYAMCEKQSVTGLAFLALDRLNKCGQRPPTELLYEWIGVFEKLKAQNALMNSEAARLTKMLENEGHRTVILKGQANALLYPNPLSRQPGDIDIWVSGGMENVQQTLRKLDLLEGDLSKYKSGRKATIGYHHIHLPKNENGVDVEVHFRPSSGNRDPFTNRRLQAFLKDEIDRDNELTEAGFRVPSMVFALVMQLAHIQRHFLTSGVGMRQIMDYYFLLKSGNKNPLKIENGKLKCLGLEKMAGALMWMLHEKLGLEKEYLIAPVDEKRGKMLLAVMMEGGNFGHYSQQIQKGFSITGALRSRFEKYKFLRFNARETIWGELNYVGRFVASIPERVRRRSLTLRA